MQQRKKTKSSEKSGKKEKKRHPSLSTLKSNASCMLTVLNKSNKKNNDMLFSFPGCNQETTLQQCSFPHLP
jgi:hypothetical protein